MKEDLAEWLSLLYPALHIHAENFMDCLQTGEHLLRVSRERIVLKVEGCNLGTFILPTLMHLWASTEPTNHLGLLSLLLNSGIEPQSFTCKRQFYAVLSFYNMTVNVRMTVRFLGIFIEFKFWISFADGPLGTIRQISEYQRARLGVSVCLGRLSRLSPVLTGQVWRNQCDIHIEISPVLTLESLMMSGLWWCVVVLLCLLSTAHSPGLTT